MGLNGKSGYHENFLREDPMKLANSADSPEARSFASHVMLIGDAKMMTVSPTFRVCPAADVPAGCLVLPYGEYHEGVPSFLVSGGKYLLHFFDDGILLEAADEKQLYVVIDTPLRLVVDPMSAVPSVKRTEASVGDIVVAENGCFLCSGLDSTPVARRKAWVNLQTWVFAGNVWDGETFKRWKLLADSKGNGSFEMTLVSWGE